MKFHLKMLLEDTTFGNVDVNEEHYSHDLQPSIKLLQSKFASESFEVLDPKLLNEIKNLYDSKLGKNFNLKDFRLKELKDLISVFSFSNNELEPYSKDDSKVEALAERIEDLESIKLTKRLWKDLLISSCSYSEKSRVIIYTLCLKVFGTLRKEKKASHKLMKIHHEFKLFSDECYRTIALKMMNENDSEVLDRLYMKRLDFQSGFGERVVDEISILISSYLNNINIERARHITTVLSDDNGKFIVSKKLYTFVSSLLLNFKNRNVSDDIVEVISQFIEANLGDPRVRIEWTHIDSEARKVFLRWKVAASTELFFKIITQSLSSKPEEYKERWRKRELFWRKYLYAEVIHSAWLALSRQGESYYKSVSLKEAKVPYGTINRQNSMIIFFIDNLMIVEFAPTGQVSIWRTGTKGAPEAYASRYDEEAIRHCYKNKPLFVGPHDNGGNWMNEVEKIIYKETNIKIKNEKRKLYY